MTNEATIDKMNQMKLYGMLHAFRTSMDSNLKENFTPDELIAHLVEAEWEDRYNRKLDRLLKTARFRYQATIGQIDFQPKRNINKNLLLRLSTDSWLKKAENVIITGPTGTGKSFLACALGHQAAINGFKVLYFNTLKLFSKLKYAKADGSYAKELGRIQTQNLLILDDFGLHPIDEQSKLILLELFEDRYGRKSTLITSQFPTNKWHDIIANPTIADAICDRIIHNAYHIELKGESMRKTRKDSG
jgi:DNA replication protein DnaC